MFKNVFIFVALAIPGFILAKSKMVTQDKTVSISKIITYVGVPFLILDSTIRMDFSGDALTVLIIAGVLSVVVTALGFFATNPITKGFSDIKKRGVARFAMFSSNNGFLGIPLAQAVFGNSPATTFLIVLNILTNIFMFTVGVYLISGDKGAINVKKAFLSPVLISFLLGVAFNLLGVKNLLPEISDYTSYFSAIVTPLSMTILGIKMASIKFPAMFKCKDMYGVSIFKLLIVPILASTIMLLLKLLNVVDVQMLLGFFVAFATPTASLSSTFADQYGGDTESAVYCTLGSTVFCVATIPILYGLLCMLI
jgi:predicted permease